MIASTVVLGLTLGFAGTATAKPMSAKDFRKAANDICAEGNRQFRAAADEILSESEEITPAQAEAYVDAIAPIVEDRIDGIADLEPPKKLRKKVKRLLALAREELADLVDDPTILLESDPFAETNTGSIAIGLRECAGG
jgi:hypothetical protein